MAQRRRSSTVNARSTRDVKNGIKVPIQITIEVAYGIVNSPRASDDEAHQRSSQLKRFEK
jgi:hypothetical protein